MTNPYLQPPGAGISVWQRIVGEAAMRWFGRRSHAKSQHDFQQAVQQIITLCKNIPPDRRDDKILVPKQFGMEDSSRFWSINLTLEHVMIVSKGITDIILALSHNRNVPGTINMSELKPRGTLQSEALTPFKEAMQDCYTRLEARVVQSGTKRHKHPWFGPMTAAQWHALLGLHTTIHRKQIAAIIQGLKAEHAKSPSKTYTSADKVVKTNI